MPRKPSITIVGPGRLGSTLALALSSAGYKIDEIVHRGRAGAAKEAARLARNCRSRPVAPHDAQLNAGVVWFCVPDRSIRTAARQLARATDWHGKVALHASGALTSDELSALRRRGASIASAHPLMTFVTRSQPALAGVPFAIEGDRQAAQVARQLVRALGGAAFSVEKRKKAAYHTWGAFTSPLLIALLTTSEEVARSAGISAAQARHLAVPILRQTLENYARLGSAEAFSGPIVRGDTATLRRHLRSLHHLPQARAVYLSLARSALRLLPSGKRAELRRILR